MNYKLFMLRILRSNYRFFSSQKLKTLKQKYNANPTEVKPAFEYIRVSDPSIT